jgi:hypothetical protein
MLDGSYVHIGEFLRSLYAIECVPFPVLDVDAHNILKVLRVRGSAADESVYCEPFSSLSPLLSAMNGITVLGLEYKSVWKSACISHALTYTVRGMQVYQEKLVGRLLLVQDATTIQPGSQLPQGSPCGRASPGITCSVRKAECMYRTNWNKKRPLGVSNPIYSATFQADVTELVLGTGHGLGPDSHLAEMLFLVCHNCLACDYEKFLGIYCPLPNDLDPIKSLRNEDVMRKLKTVPQYSISADRVSFIVARVLERILPERVWVNGINWRRLIQEFINLPSRYDVVNVEDFPTGLRKFIGHEIRGACKRTNIESKISLFVLRRIIVPVTSYLFYVTEADDGSCVYFRRPVWDILVTKASSHLVDMLHLEHVPDSKRTDGSSVRWIPKVSGGLRPVVRQAKFIKDRTKRLLRYLKSLACKFKQKLGYSVFSRDVLHDRLLDLQRSGNPSNRLYMLAADIQNCFESVSFAGLEAALMDFFPRDPITFSSVMISTFSVSGTPRSKKPIVFIQGDLENLADQLPRGPIKAEAAGPVVTERLTSRDVLVEILKIVKNSAYWLNTKGSTTSKELFRVTSHGLPQGSSFSVMLVAIYYGFLDRHVLKIPRNPSVCIIRLVDDILCLTRDFSVIERINKFIVVQQRYGPVNVSKVKSAQLTGNETVKWAGFTLTPNQSGIMYNVSADVTEGRNTIRKKTPMRLVDIFRSILARSIAQHSLPILMDRRINSTSCLQSNAYRAGEVTGQRLASFAIKYDDKEIELLANKLDRFARKRFGRLIRKFQLGFEHGFHR